MITEFSVDTNLNQIAARMREEGSRPKGPCTPLSKVTLLGFTRDHRPRHVLVLGERGEDLRALFKGPQR